MQASGFDNSLGVRIRFPERSYCSVAFWVSLLFDQSCLVFSSSFNDNVQDHFMPGDYVHASSSELDGN